MALPSKESLSPKLVAAWLQTVCDLARLKGKKKTDLASTLKEVAAQEKDALAGMREIFNQDRESLSFRLLSERPNIVAYLLGFHVPNLFRLHATLKRVQIRWKLQDWLKEQSKNQLCVWDLGCGSGAMAQEVCEQFANHFASTRVYLYDTSTPLLNATKAIFAQRKFPNVQLFPRKVGLHDLHTEPHVQPQGVHVIGLGYVWNELARNIKARRKILALVQHLVAKEQRILVIALEPAQEEATREAMQLRDEIVQMSLQPLYPCSNFTLCPMLERSRDWCYSEFPLQGYPEEMTYIDRFVGVDRTTIAAAAFVFASPVLASELRANLTAPQIVVGRPQRKESTGFDYLVCTATGTLTKKPGTNEAEKSPLLRGQFV